MTDARSAWHETGERFSSLGAKLKQHYEQQRGTDAEQSKAEVRDALKRLSGALEDAFEAIGSAARDDAVKSDVKQVGQSLVGALGVTFNEVSAEVQRAFNRGEKGEKAAGAPAGPGSPAPQEPQDVSPPADPGEAGSGATGPAAQGPGDQPTSADQPPKVEPWGTP
ncbi:MAG TPA: hypothetical protein VFP72_15375 [Kineosporiaceae bacterium]|nr:hypothetical protein [Kineosporiaceae bacterium]